MKPIIEVLLVVVAAFLIVYGVVMVAECWAQRKFRRERERREMQRLLAEQAEAEKELRGEPVDINGDIHIVPDDWKHRP